jgi:hypothetical protein
VDNLVSVFDSALPGSSCAPGESPLNWSQTGATGPVGPPGPQGPPGVAGQGVLGEARQWVDVKLSLPASGAPGDIPDLSFPLPPGNWSVAATLTYRSATFDQDTTHWCELREADAPKQTYPPGKSLTFLPKAVGFFDVSSTTLVGLFQSSGGGVVIDCRRLNLASDTAELKVTSLVAVRVGEMQRFLPQAPPPGPPSPATVLALSLSAGQQGKLRDTYYSPTASAGARRRAETVLLADQGKSAEEIAQATFSTPAQVRSAVRAFRRR